MSNMIIPIGNIGSGKSLLAGKFARKGYVVANMDSITRMIAGGEYGAYDNTKKEVYHNAEQAVISTALHDGFSVYVDRTNMDAKRRERYIELGKYGRAKITALHFGPGDEKGLQRRLKNSHGIPEKQWREVWKKMAESYNPPTIDEGFDDIIQAPQKFKIHAFDFDGYVVENVYPEIGELNKEVSEYIKKLYDDLSNIIIIWTCRFGDDLNRMRKFLISNSIPFDFINENPLFETGSRKIYATHYYDDRNSNIQQCDKQG